MKNKLIRVVSKQFIKEKSMNDNIISEELDKVYREHRKAKKQVEFSLLRPEHQTYIVTTAKKSIVVATAKESSSEGGAI